MDDSSSGEELVDDSGSDYDSEGSFSSATVHNTPEDFFSPFNFPIYTPVHKENYYSHCHLLISPLISAFEDLDYRLNMPLVNYWSGLSIKDGKTQTLWSTKRNLESKLESFYRQASNVPLFNIELKRLTNHLFVRRYTMLTLEENVRINDNRWNVAHSHPPQKVLDFHNYQHYDGACVLRKQNCVDPVPLWRPGQELRLRSKDFVVY
jgi:hypothetical protein